MEQTKQLESYKIVYAGGSDEFVEKKSRFIATVRPVETEYEATAFIEEIKKKYWDAKHNCSAFIIGKRAELTRCSDDGEPSGTAGRPILEVLLGEEIRNVAVVVSRYFGGTLLGTGGLVRAYTKAVQLGLEASEITTMQYGIRLKIMIDYSGVGKIQYILGQEGITTYETTYTEQVVFTVVIPIGKVEKIKKIIMEATAANVRIEEMGTLYFIAKVETL